jgi:hypothetical protein
MHQENNLIHLQPKIALRGRCNRFDDLDLCEVIASTNGSNSAIPILTSRATTLTTLQPLFAIGLRAPASFKTAQLLSHFSAFVSVDLTS